MDQPLKFNTGDRRIFSPAAHTVGWTVERDRSLSFKYSNVPPQQLKGRTVVVVASLEGDVYQVYFDGDSPLDYFECCGNFLLDLDCRCSIFVLFNYGCRCGKAI